MLLLWWLACTGSEAPGETGDSGTGTTYETTDPCDAGDGEAWALLGYGASTSPPEVRLWSGASLAGGWDLAAPDGRVVVNDCGLDIQVAAMGDLDGDGLSELVMSLPANER